MENLTVKEQVNEIESALIELVRNLIRNKKFVRYLVDNRYPIAIDGTQKCVRDVLWALGVACCVLCAKNVCDLDNTCGRKARPSSPARPPPPPRYEGASSQSK